MIIYKDMKAYLRAEKILHKHIDKKSMDGLSVNVWPDILEAIQEHTKAEIKDVIKFLERLQKEYFYTSAIEIDLYRRPYMDGEAYERQLNKILTKLKEL